MVRLTALIVAGVVAALLAAGPGLSAVLVDGSEGWRQVHRMAPEDLAPESWFGWSVAFDGETAAVGAPAYETQDPHGGHVFVYARAGSGTDESSGGAGSGGAGSGGGDWELVQVLDGPGPGSGFGHAVDVEGRTLIVGAPRADTPDAAFAGGVFVYERDGSQGWDLVSVFAGDDSDLGDQFGTSVALEGDRLAVGAIKDEPHGLDWEGSAYVFDRAGGSWVQEAKLVPNDPDPLARFGFDISLYGDQALVGVLSHDGQEIAGGSAFVFERDGSGWSQTAQLWPGDPGAFHRFGSSVALDGDRAVIGAPGQLWSPYPGAAYVFERQQDGGWSEVARWDGDNDPESTFGSDVDIHGSMAVVGAVSSDDLDYPDALPRLPKHGELMGSGAAFVYTSKEGAWGLDRKIMPEDRGGVGPVALDDGTELSEWDHDWFGHALDLEGVHLLVGAPWDDTAAGDNAGSAHLFSAGCSWVTVPAAVAPPAPPCTPLPGMDPEVDP